MKWQGAGPEDKVDESNLDTILNTEMSDGGASLPKTNLEKLLMLEAKKNNFKAEMRIEIEQMMERIKNGESPDNIDPELLKSFDIHSLCVGTSSNIEVEQKIEKLKKRVENLSKHYVEKKEYIIEIEEIKESIDGKIQEVMKAEEDKKEHD